MARRDDYRSEVAALGDADLRGYLAARSGLPGPRANLELLDAVADVAAPSVIRRLAGSDDEFERSCGVAGFGRLVVDAGTSADLAVGAPGAASDLECELRKFASDASWRVREAVAMALQRVGDADPPRLRALVAAWAEDDDPLVQRAAVAGICEPRLLRDPRTAAVALVACRVATDALASLPSTRRREPDVRTLRRALGYCWSVAVAGDPDSGVPAFERLRAATDPDVGWIVRENLRKARLRRLIEPQPR